MGLDAGRCANDSAVACHMGRKLLRAVASQASLRRKLDNGGILDLVFGDDSVP
jgi:hypothetical protein